MDAYEIMLSESQERMLMVLRPDREAMAEAVFAKWGVDFAVVGRLTESGRLVLRHGGRVVGDIPIRPLVDDAPEYDRPWLPTPAPTALSAAAVSAPESLADALVDLLASPDLARKSWIWEQYDHTVMADTIQRPGGDAAVVRVHGTEKALAISTDCTPRYCAAAPAAAAAQAEAECWRKRSGGGAEPLAITDCLNFGNPERPEIMGQLVGCIEGIGAACRALDFPVVSGNVSLYNETNGQAILPTPTIGGVGLLAQSSRMATLAFGAEDLEILLVGETRGHLGQSLYLRECAGRADGPPPPVDLAAERRNGDFVRAMIAAGRVEACHDVADGGLAVALAEMCLAGGIGAEIAIPDGALLRHAFLFGEDQARYLVAARPAAAAEIRLAAAAGVPIMALGMTGGDCLTVRGEFTISLSRLRDANERWLPAYMAAPSEANRG